MVLDRDLLDLVHAVGHLEDVLGLGEAGLDVAPLGLDVVDDVALAVVDVFGVLLVVDDGAPGSMASSSSNTAGRTS